MVLKWTQQSLAVLIPSLFTALKRSLRSLKLLFDLKEEPGKEWNYSQTHLIPQDSVYFRTQGTVARRLTEQSQWGTQMAAHRGSAHPPPFSLRWRDLIDALPAIQDSMPYVRRVGNTLPTVACQYLVCHKRICLMAPREKKYRIGMCGERNGTLQSACRLCLFVWGAGIYLPWCD